jgi:acyl-CoA dehydrogenase
MWRRCVAAGAAAARQLVVAPRSKRQRNARTLSSSSVTAASSSSYPEIREAVRALCARFPHSYWDTVDVARAYPTEFVQALQQAGYLSILVPEKYGGSGLPLSAACAVLEEIHASGGNGGAAHAQMYTMGTLLFHGTEAQRERWLPRIATGEVRLQAFGVSEPDSGTDTLSLRTSVRASFVSPFRC